MIVILCALLQDHQRAVTAWMCLLWHVAMLGQYKYAATSASFPMFCFVLVYAHCLNASDAVEHQDHAMSATELAHETAVKILMVLQIHFCY